MAKIMNLEICTMGNIDESLVKKVVKEVKNFLPFLKKCSIGKRYPIPEDANDPSRNQYRAEIILDRLSPILREEVTVVLTDIDLYTSNMNFIFGLAHCPGKVAIVSLTRLDPKFYGLPSNPSLFLQRTVKEVVHEVGHLLGLGHCFSRTCVMRFSNSILEVDEKSPALCERCRNRLRGL